MSRPTWQLAKRQPPEVIGQADLEHSARLLEGATPEQLTAIVDRDLWSAPLAGHEERFSVERFGEWLEALVDQGAATAARIVERLDPRLVAAGLSRYVRVFDPGVLIPTASSDDEPFESGLFESNGSVAEVGGYMVQARREDAWDAIVGLVVELSTGHEACFHAIVQECRRLSDGVRETDGLDDLLEAPDQSLHDLAVERGDRRTERGFGRWADARAFLAMARERRASSRGEGPGLLPGAAGLEPLMQYLLEHDPNAYFERGQELAFLANALVAGCGLRSGPFTPPEAVRAAVATCSLGLLRQPAPPGLDYLGDCGLVRLFEDGWAALHREVSMFVAEKLLVVLSRVRVGDSDTLEGLQALRSSLETHLHAGTPWLVVDDLDVLAVLDTPTWHGLCGLLSECPVVPDAVTAIVERRTGRIDPDGFAFIGSEGQIDTVRGFMARLPQQLAA